MNAPLPPFGTALVHLQAVSTAQVHAAARVLRRSCPDPAARGRLAELLESFDTTCRLGAVVPELIMMSFVEAVLALADAAPATDAIGDEELRAIVDRHEGTVRQAAESVRHAAVILLRDGYSVLARRLLADWAAFAEPDGLETISQPDVPPAGGS